MNTIIGASLTTRTDGLGTARYSDPVSGSGGGGFQGPQGIAGVDGIPGPQGSTGPQGPSGGGGGGLIGTAPIIDSQMGTDGVQNFGLRYDTQPGLLLVGNPAVATKRNYATLEFTSAPGPQGLQVRFKAPFEAVTDGLGLALGQGLDVPGAGPFQDTLNVALAPIPGLEFDGSNLLLVKVKDKAGIILDGDGLSASVDASTVVINGAGQLTAPGSSPTIGTPPIITSKTGTAGTAAEGLKYNTKPGLQLVQNPADGTALTQPTMEFTTGPNGLQIKIGKKYYLGTGEHESLDVCAGGGAAVSGLVVKIEDDKGIEVGANGLYVKAGDGTVIDSSGVSVGTDDLTIDSNYMPGNKIQLRMKPNGGLAVDGGGVYVVWNSAP